VLVWSQGTMAQNVTLDLGLAQLEAGAVATDFARRPLSTELGFCAEYFRRYNDPTAAFAILGIGQAYDGNSAVVFLQPKMRANFTTSFSSLALNNLVVTDIAFFANHIGGAVIDVDVASGLTANGMVRFQQNASTSGFLTLDAEL
jgi:hypothetical protein